jgi:hypothetical protein
MMSSLMSHWLVVVVVEVVESVGWLENGLVLALVEGSTVGSSKSKHAHTRQPCALMLSAGVDPGLHLQGSDPFVLRDELLSRPQSDNVDASHAFYLGYEMAKASIALQLGKQYEQDRALRWGHLTVEEDLHRIKRTSRHRKSD